MTFQVTNETERRAARKILRRRGLPTDQVHRMSYAALNAELTAHPPSAEAWAEALRAALQPAAPRPVSPPVPDPYGQVSPPVPDPYGQPAPSYAAPEPVPAGPSIAAGTIDASVAALVQTIVATLPRPAPVAAGPDLATVQAMVDVAIRDRLPVTVAVTVNGGAPRTVDGIVHERFPLVAQALAARQHVWLPGPAGSGKSTLARQALHAMGYDDSQIFMTGAIETAYELKGYRSPHGDPATLLTPLRLSIESAKDTGRGAFIFDDVDRSNAKALAAFNELLANGHASFPDGMVQIPDGWLCIATANTFGLGGGADYVGAARLDKATLDRFVYVEIPYDERQEAAIARSLGDDGTWTATVQHVRSACRRLGLKHLVTPRATYKGLRLIAAGMARADVETATVYAGLDTETLARVKAAI